ncbi:MAG: hypothetical protein ACO3IB_07585, partial [Phycisphaerales bacterium]
MLVLHAVWTRERLHFWAEDSTLLEGALAIVRGTAADGAAAVQKQPEAGHAPAHAFACDATRLR